MTKQKQLSFALRGYPWGDFERHVIQATLDFANMGLGAPEGIEHVSKHIAVAEDVEKLFEPFAREMLVIPRPKNAQRLFSTVPTRGAGLLTGVVFKRQIVETYQRQQQELREALTGLLTKGTVSRAFHSRLDGWLRDIPFRLGFEHGSMIYRFSVPSVAAGWALGVAVLLESDYLLRQCEECSRYFAIFHPKKRNQRYCSKHCAKEAESAKAAERVQNWRKRQQKRGR